MRSEWHWFVRCDLQIFSGCACHLEQLHAQSPFLLPIVFSIIDIYHQQRGSQSGSDRCSVHVEFAPLLLSKGSSERHRRLSQRTFAWKMRKQALRTHGGYLGNRENGKRKDDMHPPNSKPDRIQCSSSNALPCAEQFVWLTWLEWLEW